MYFTNEGRARRNACKKGIQSNVMVYVLSQVAQAITALRLSFHYLKGNALARTWYLRLASA